MVIKNMKRELIDGAAAITFEYDGQKYLEWLDIDNENMLTMIDSHLEANARHLNLEAVVEELEDWLHDNPIKIEWVRSVRRDIFDGSMSGGEYDTLAQAKASLEGVKSELLAACSTAEQVAAINAGRLEIYW